MKSQLAIFLIGICLFACDLYSPPDYVKHYKRGLKHYERGRLDKAVEEYETAFRLHTGTYGGAKFDAEMHYHLGRAYADQGRLDEAIAEYKEAISILHRSWGPDAAYPMAYAHLELARRKKSRGEEATDEPIVAVLSEILRDGDRDWGIRANMALALGEIGDPAAIPALTETLGSDKRLTGAIVKALGDIGGTGAVPGLVEALSDSDWQIRNSAAFNLGQIGEPAKDSIPVLLETLDDENLYVRYHAADALINIDSSKQAMVVPVLIQLLEDIDESGRFMVLSTLKSIRTPEAKKAVENWDKRKAAGRTHKTFIKTIRDVEAEENLRLKKEFGAELLVTTGFKSD